MRQMARVSAATATMLEAQIRTSTGFTWRGGSATGPTLAGVREAQGRELGALGRKPAAAEGKTGEARAVANAAALFTALSGIAERGGVLPPNAGLARITGLTMADVAAALDRLVLMGSITFSTSYGKRTIRLVTAGVVLRTAMTPVLAAAEG